MATPTVTPRCEQCKAPMVEIRLEREGSTMTMRSCSTCDLRSWHRDGAPVSRDAVLESVGATSKRR